VDVSGEHLAELESLIKTGLELAAS
jgi:hypothetical protein